ncbi:MAG: ferritin [Armatimonadia bacterium]|nr:ferritin [Armatimonadia bacterium]
MIDERMNEAINKQINAELLSAYIYYSMAQWFEGEDLPGMAAWMYAQTQEEMFHAHKFANYVNERGGRVVMAAIDEPQTEWDSPVAVFEHALEHEQWVTGNINGLMDLAIEINDHASKNFLVWYVDEQVEEEDNVGGVLAKLERVADSPNGLYMLDKELGARSFAPPAAEEEE